MMPPLLYLKTFGTALIFSWSQGVYSQAAEQLPLATFGSIQNLNGNVNFNTLTSCQYISNAPQYDRTDIDFTDGLAVDVLSPTNRTFRITQNSNPLSGSFVSGTTGEGWRAIQPYSYVVQVSQPANDLIAKIELPYDPTMLNIMGIDQANTAVGKLSQDGKSWMISEPKRNVHV
jgi:hypothetical protein